MKMVLIHATLPVVFINDHIKLENCLNDAICHVSDITDVDLYVIVFCFLPLLSNAFVMSLVSIEI